MTAAAPCDLSTIHTIKNETLDILATVPGIDIMAAELRLDAEYAAESKRSGDMACEPSNLKSSTDRYARSLLDMQAAIREEN